MNISIIGSGHVGLVSAACFAELGNRVLCHDSDPAKIAALKKGKVHFYEPGLNELVADNLKNKRLIFTNSIQEAVVSSQVIFIAVGTKGCKNGEADLSSIQNVSRAIARYMDGYRLIVEKSTVPVETCDWIRKTIKTALKKNYKFDVVSNPEFLREGRAISDFNRPQRIVLGVESAKARQLLSGLYRPLNAPILVTNIRSAELIKHASNAFLATKISFINAIARICEGVGADVNQVARGMGLDSRIGGQFLGAGLGYGGSCFPKDLEAFIAIAKKCGYDFGLLKAVKEVNRDQLLFVLGKIKKALAPARGKTAAVLGLSFKPDTDDLRNSPSICLVNALMGLGVKIKAYDPKAMPAASRMIKGIKFSQNPYLAASGSDCLIVATEWNEFKELDFARIKKALKKPLLIDCRNIYDPGQLEKAGFTYLGVGRRSAQKP